MQREQEISRKKVSNVIFKIVHFLFHKCKQSTQFLERWMYNYLWRQSTRDEHSHHIPYAHKGKAVANNEGVIKHSSHKPQVGNGQIKALI